MKTKKILTIAVAALLLTAMLFALTACGGEKEPEAPADPAKAIIGSWKYKSGNYVYTFKEDGTGSYDAAGNLMEFTYEIDGENISILYSGSSSPFKTTFSINGNQLDVKDSLGNSTIYNKQ